MYSSFYGDLKILYSVLFTWKSSWWHSKWPLIEGGRYYMLDCSHKTPVGKTKMTNFKECGSAVLIMVCLKIYLILDTRRILFFLKPCRTFIHWELCFNIECPFWETLLQESHLFWEILCIFFRFTMNVIVVFLIYLFIYFYHKTMFIYSKKACWKQTTNLLQKL